MLTDKSKCQRSSLKHLGSRRIKKAFFVLRSSFFQDQAPTALWINNHPPIQDQAPTALEESVLRSSFIVLPRSSPDDPWINRPPIQDQAPTALEESTIVHHLFIQDQAPTALWINNVDKSTRPTVLQDQAQKPLKICSSLFLQDQAQKPLKIRSSPLLKIKPQRLLEDLLKSTFKDQAHGPLKKLLTVHPRSSPNGPWINETSTNTHLTEIESEDQNRERL
ncbi:hypothetical protein ACFX14_032339 [Malus domestica]